MFGRYVFGVPIHEEHRQWFSVDIYLFFAHFVVGGMTCLIISDNLFASYVDIRLLRAGHTFPFT